MPPSTWDRWPSGWFDRDGVTDDIQGGDLMSGSHSLRRQQDVGLIGSNDAEMGKRNRSGLIKRVEAQAARTIRARSEAESPGTANSGERGPPSYPAFPDRHCKRPAYWRRPRIDSRARVEAGGSSSTSNKLVEPIAKKTTAKMERMIRRDLMLSSAGMRISRSNNARVMLCCDPNLYSQCNRLRPNVVRLWPVQRQWPMALPSSGR